MRHNHILSLIVVLCTCFGIPLTAQNNCGPEVVVDTNGFSGTAFFNYGSHARSKSQSYRTSIAIGQTFVGYTEDVNFNSTVGFYSRFLLAPFALSVMATQGDLLDRIQVTWEIDALGPSPNEGFNIYRDGVFLATVGANIRNYNDFNVIPGRPYIYTIRGLNAYGEGASSDALGFQVPNGVVTGWISTLSGSPVPDALVTLTPMQGFSALFGADDGAFALADANQNPFLPPLGHDWTMTFWIKTDNATANASLIQMGSTPFYIRAMNSSTGHEGIEVATSSEGTPFLGATLPDSNKNEWHHVALSFDYVSHTGRLYVDGVLQSISPMNEVASPDTLQIAGTGDWNGRMDELRIYDRKLDELDFGHVMVGTASSQTPFLTHYWKMDEELGVKSYDIMKRHKLYFCGAAFDADRPPVHTAGISNEDGYYRIESASYGTGTTFLAQPKKDFYMHRALKFNRSEQDYATLPDFSLTAKSTIELWVNSAGPDGPQCIVSKKWSGNEFRLMLVPNGLVNDIKIVLNGQEHNYGQIANGYQHLAFTLDSLTGNVAGYKNGNILGSFAYGNVSGNWSSPTEPWLLGARKNGVVQTDYYGGLIDEIAVYDTTLNATAILAHFESDRNLQENGLRIYFPLDEGNGNNLGNVGSVFLDAGTTAGTQWSPLAANQGVEPHIFTPATRQVTLNPSVTSVDQVDFVDRSTVAVSGYVRYKNTDCFAKNVEILVNGESFTPKIFTDTTGRFAIDFDPGTTAKLTPVFEDHSFIPAFWDVTNVSSPIAGILFNDVTTRTITGQVAGGLCKKSIIVAPPGSGQGTFCVVKVRSADGCLERQMLLDNVEGNFTFSELPPLEVMTVAVVEHSDPLIKTAFQVQGGLTVDLTKRDTAMEFIYFAPPEVEIVSGLDPYSMDCDKIVLDQGESVELNIRMKEQYVASDGDDGICYLDTASFRIINGFTDEVLDTTMSNGMLTYEFIVGSPNPSPPYLKTLQILGTSLGGVEGSLTKQAIVTGVRNKLNTFTTLLPEIPTLILRDPPGDGSSSFLQKDEKVCKTTTVVNEFETGFGADLEVEVAPSLTLVLAPLGIGVIQTIDADVLLNTEAQVTYNRISNNSFETCVSFSTKVSTNSGELVVGSEHGADVYLGEALNIIFGLADKVSFNDTICEPAVKVILNVEPGDFATTFVYSEFNIRNNVLRYLDLLANSPDADSADVARYTESKMRWEAILERNALLKDSAEVIRNISFDAGVVYEYSETSDTTTTETIENAVNSEFSIATGFGFSINDVGFKGNVKFITNTSNSFNDVSSVATGVTTGYTLSDNEPGDAFTIDVGMDSVYKTPVFKIKAGQSSCPWEAGTANREAPNMQLAEGSEFVAINVPANEAASFEMELGNLSASNEDWTYAFTSVAANNPHGAVIKLNGQPLNYLQKFIIPYGTSQMVTLTVERGPVEYDYDSLLVALVSECEYERHLALSIPVASDPKFFSPIYLGVHFIRPCSEVNINVPEQDWVIFPDPLTPGPDDERRITVSGYDTTEQSFKLIRVQYRRSNGDGAWINIPGISDRYNPNWIDFDALPDPKPPVLQPDFTQFFWESTGLSDGPYEIRAVTVCSGDATDRPGYSQVIRGRIDREPPSLVGVPQPSDGVFHVGDEISFTFNQDINCNKIFTDNAELYNATTNELIDALVTCVDNKIIFDPQIQNEFFENRILRAELHEIEDLTGNVLIEEQWEFYVDRNELAWLTDSIGLTKYVDENKTITAKIHNRGGYPVPFAIQNVPDWVNVTPDAGTLVANEIRDISFTVDSSIAIGNYADSIVLHTETGENPFFMGGDEALPFGARVICRPPFWNLIPGNYQLTMNMILRLSINSNYSVDPEDQIGVFISGELRGTSKLTYLPEYGYWVAFVTVYGNTTDGGKPLVYEIFDASACQHHPATLSGNFTFVANSVVGLPNAPGIVTTGSMLIRELYVKPGWNWLSFNLGFPNSAINAVLNNINNPNADLIKDQTKFSTFGSGTWSGALSTITNTTLYLYQAAQANTIKITGNALNPATTPIPVVAGWNWIGYIPNYTLPINAALGSIPKTAGDVIKSQSSFAQYVNSTIGWVGNLTHLKPGQGYMLKTALAGSIVFPVQGLTEEEPIVSRNPTTHWDVNASQYEHNMTMIAMFQFNDGNATTEDMELGAFVGGEIRGVAKAVYIEAMDAYMFFLTSFANKQGEQMHFKLYDATTDEVSELEERMTFSANMHQGSIDAPIPFTLGTTAVDDVQDDHDFTISPNPFHNELVCQIVVATAQEIQLSITDMKGVEVYSINQLAQEGMNRITWNGHSYTGAALSNGMYLVRLQTDLGLETRKVLLQR